MKHLEPTHLLRDTVWNYLSNFTLTCTDTDLFDCLDYDLKKINEFESFDTYLNWTKERHPVQYKIMMNEKYSKLREEFDASMDELKTTIKQLITDIHKRLDELYATIATNVKFDEEEAVLKKFFSDETKIINATIKEFSDEHSTVEKREPT